MPNVIFKLDNEDAPKTSILLYFHYDRKRLVYSTKQSIEPIYWNKEKGRARNAQTFPQAKSLNQFLDIVETHCQAAYRQYLRQSHSPTVTELRQELDYRLKRKKRDAADFFGFVDQLLEERERSGKFAKGTIRTLRLAKNVMSQFADYRKKFDFQDIDLNFFYDFLEWGENVKRYSRNNLAKTVRNLKTFLREAEERGLPVNKAYKSKRFRLTEVKVDTIYYDVKELGKLYDKEMPGERLERIRDLFIVQCFTGLRFSDIKRLSVNHVVKIQETPFIRIETMKTKAPVMIPLHPYVRAVINKYQGVLPTISDVKFNSYLKEMMQIAGFKEPITINKTKAGKRYEVTKEKWELTTSHTARRSFCTNAYKAGVPIPAIRMITGHKTDRAFMAYIKVTEEENAILMSQNPFFKGSHLRVG